VGADDEQHVVFGNCHREDSSTKLIPRDSHLEGKRLLHYVHNRQHGSRVSRDSVKDVQLSDEKDVRNESGVFFIERRKTRHILPMASLLGPSSSAIT
jgi:hypothetical protein